MYRPATRVTTPAGPGRVWGSERGKVVVEMDYAWLVEFEPRTVRPEPSHLTHVCRVITPMGPGRVWGTNSRGWPIVEMDSPWLVEFTPEEVREIEEAKPTV